MYALLPDSQTAQCKGAVQKVSFSYCQCRHLYMDKGMITVQGKAIQSLSYKFVSAAYIAQKKIQ